jgi:peptidoglycan/LPS O-acetylase OafA/YrhL
LQQRLDYIDGFRGIAALYVVVHHVFTSVYGDAPLLVSGGGLTAYMFLPFLYGRAGVDLFLVVSGFVLFHPIVSAKRELEPYMRFMFRRAWRIVPPYYAAIGLSLAAIQLVPGLGGALQYSDKIDAGVIATHLLLVNNLGSARDMFAINYPLWTIPLEFQLYAAFPLLVWMIARVGALRAVTVAVIFTLAGRWGIAHTGATALVNSVPGFLSVFALGILAADATVAHPAILERYRWRLFAAAIVFIGLGVLSWHTRGSYLLSDTSWGVGFACLLMSARTFQLGPFVPLGRFSYSLYLVHAPLLACLVLLSNRYSLVPEHAMWTLLLVGVPLIVALAYLFHWVCERPFLRLPAWYLRQPQL